MTRLLVTSLAFGFLALVTTELAAASPWAGDCEAFLSIEAIISKVKTGGTISAREQNLLHSYLLREDEVLASLAAYALGHVSEKKEDVLEQLQLLEEKAKCRARDVDRNISVGYVRVAQCVIVSDPEIGMERNLLERLLNDSNAYATLWAAKQLIDQGEISLVKLKLESMKDGGGMESASAQALLLYAQEPQKGYIPEGYDEFVMVEMVIEGDYSYYPCDYMRPPQAIRAIPGSSHNNEDL